MSIKETSSQERKRLKAEGLIPEWFTTDGLNFFKQKYQYEAASYKEQLQRIARTAAKHTKDVVLWEDKFFNLLWKGWLSPSTPVLSNMGTSRGLPVSCFVAGTKVNTIDGQKNIEDLRINDIVLTHTNEYHRVVRTISQESSDLYELEIKGEVFHVTGNHLILTKEHDWVRVDELDPEIHDIVQIEDDIVL